MTAPSDAVQRELEPLSTQALASGELHPLACHLLVLTLRRFQTLIRAIERIRAASAGPS